LLADAVLVVVTLELGSAAAVAGALVELVLRESCLTAEAEVLVLVAMVRVGLGRGGVCVLGRGGWRGVWVVC
jgi:hypothetical protein